MVWGSVETDGVRDGCGGNGEGEERGGCVCELYFLCGDVLFCGGGDDAMVRSDAEGVHVFDRGTTNDVSV